jgi:hypothetical protein
MRARRRHQPPQLRKDSRVELPLWLASALTSRHLTSVDTPSEYGEW